jgi:hypothetical protein
MHSAEAEAREIPLSEPAAGMQLAGARDAAEAAYTGLRRFMTPAEAAQLDRHWNVLLAGLSHLPALIRLNALLEFTDDMHRQIVERERAVLEAERARNAVEAERHRHMLDGVRIGTPYVAERDFTLPVDGVTISCRKGVVISDHILVAKLLALGAPVSIVTEDDSDPVCQCHACFHTFRRSEGTVRPTGRAAA